MTRTFTRQSNNALAELDTPWSIEYIKVTETPQINPETKEFLVSPWVITKAIREATGEFDKQQITNDDFVFLDSLADRLVMTEEGVVWKIPHSLIFEIIQEAWSLFEGLKKNSLSTPDDTEPDSTDR